MSSIDCPQFFISFSEFNRLSTILYIFTETDYGLCYALAMDHSYLSFTLEDGFLDVGNAQNMLGPAEYHSDQEIIDVYSCV